MLKDNFVLRCYPFIFDGCYTNAIYSFRYNNYLFDYNNYTYSTKSVQRTDLQLVCIYIYIYICVCVYERSGGGALVLVH